MFSSVLWSDVKNGGHCECALGRRLMAKMAKKYIFLLYKLIHNIDLRKAFLKEALIRAALSGLG